ncbi:hypothetical protein HUW63_05665 [Myxococcus sp. AM001]|nr:hypothetical protein [Myxococcus sp. AM001]
MRKDLPWNECFKGKTVVVPDEKHGGLPTHWLAGGLKLTLLSPTWKELVALDSEWIRESFGQGRIPGEEVATLKTWPPRIRDLDVTSFIKDTSLANGSSIAVLVEFAGRRCLLAGDAFADTLVASLKRLPGVRGRLRLDAFKLPHHASKANVNDALLQAVKCSRYLVSTNGMYFNHPDEEAIKRLFLNVGERLEICFNYRTRTTQRWEISTPLPGTPVKKYQSVYPSSSEGGLVVQLAGKSFRARGQHRSRAR